MAAARRLVLAIEERRRSALQLPSSSPSASSSSSSSIASQLLARYRRASLQEGARKQHELLPTGRAVAAANNQGTARKAKHLSERESLGRCSHRSSISTNVDEDEPSSPKRDRLQTLDLVDQEKGVGDRADDTLDQVAPLHTPQDLSVVSARHDQPRESSSAVTSSTAPRRKFGTILRELPQQELFLFREEAEYSDYLNAMVTGVHTEMDTVVYYEVEVHLSQMQWKVLRRFSEFRALRQRLLRHLSRRQRFQTTSKCMICANILQSIDQVAFPSRQQQRHAWFSSLRRRSLYEAAHSAMIIADRKHKLQDFVGACLLAMRGLRQHSRLMCDSSTCEISVALRMIEEFLGLSFTRYMRFLNERGILETDDDDTKTGTRKPSKSSPKEKDSHHHDHHADTLAARRAALAVDSSSRGRRAPTAV